MAHSPPLAPSPAALRQRRLRERRARGARIVAVEVDTDLLEILEQLGLVDPAEVDDPTALSFALLMLLSEAAEARRSRSEEISLRVTDGSKAAVKSAD